MKKHDEFDIVAPKRERNDSLGWGVASSIVALGFSLFVMNHQNKLKQLGFADQKNPLNLYKKKVSKAEYEKVLDRLERTQGLLNSIQAKNQMMSAKILSYQLNEKSALIHMKRYQDQVGITNEWREKYDQRTKNFDHLYNDYMNLQAKYLERKHTDEEAAALIIANEKLNREVAELKAQAALSWRLRNNNLPYRSDAPFNIPESDAVPSVAKTRTLKDPSNQILTGWKNWKRLSQVTRPKPYIIPAPVDKIAEDIQNYKDKKEYADQLTIANAPLHERATRDIASVKKVKVKVVETAKVLADDDQMKEWKKFLVDRDRKKYEGMRAVFNNVAMKPVEIKRAPANSPEVSLFDIKKYQQMREEYNQEESRPVAIERKPASELKPTGNHRIHIVEAGHSLTGISLRYYKDADHWQEIVKANPGIDPNALEVGMEIKVPELVKSEVEPVPVVKAEAPVVEKPVESIKVKAIVKTVTPEIPESGNVIVHIVEKGESLMTISKKYYNTHQKFKLIIKSNPDLDAMKLSPGDKINITDVEKERVIWVNGKMKPAWQLQDRQISSEPQE